MNYCTGTHVHDVILRADDYARARVRAKMRHRREIKAFDCNLRYGFLFHAAVGTAGRLAFLRTRFLPTAVIPLFSLKTTRLARYVSMMAILLCRVQNFCFFFLIISQFERED